MSIHRNIRIVVRVDASSLIGSGHVMRCLTLADRLRDSGAQILFVSRDLPGSLCDLTEQKGFRTIRLPGWASTESSAPDRDWESDLDQTVGVLASAGTPDWLIVDHYGLDSRWESGVREYARQVMVIDDLADRPHDCDVLLDQNLVDAFERRYDRLVPHTCLKLLGPQYVLLRPQFATWRNAVRPQDKASCIMIFLGGGDPENQTMKVLEARRAEHPEISTLVVVGSSNPHRDDVAQACLSMPNTEYVCQADEMAALMAQADLAVGGGGTTVWERCCIGLPSIILILAENQRAVVEHLARREIVLNLGWYNGVTSDTIRCAINDLLADPERRKRMSAASRALVDGRGTERVLKEMTC